MNRIGICGAIERLCYDKFEEAYDEGTKLGKVKAVGYSLLGSIPLGLVVCGIELLAISAVCTVKGKYLMMVDKD